MIDKKLFLKELTKLTSKFESKTYFIGNIERFNISKIIRKMNFKNRRRNERSEILAINLLIFFLA